MNAPDGEDRLIALRRRNRRVASVAIAGVCAMGLAAFASPIFYRGLIGAIGHPGALKRSQVTRTLDATDTGDEAGRPIRVAFDTNLAGGTGLTFSAERSEAATTLDRVTTERFRLSNETTHPIRIRAVFDVSPAWAAPYFFRAPTSFPDTGVVKPGASVTIPFRFFVDPRILKADGATKGLPRLTLSYAVFALPTGKGNAPDFTDALRQADGGEAAFVNDAAAD
ncbi:cytochrome c oxidase assembly protein [Pararhizobium mangrovi]|uniref:Cytochrome c oxidase assembly protein CtaG n=1 Tax=Pararhizobium mangrovi TaxID=2590452 RepID=A0A506TYP1_9HYPH|nr:cytochrome c oxidase assembly protein [Pararhizobium mangrovi]TPW26610.1 hypothetical protein FJU11_14215 [Pararhizobium mangrovi]